MQITISTDPFMNSQGLQDYHLSWMHGLLARPITSATGIDPVALKSQADGTGFQRSEFFRLSQVPFDDRTNLTTFDGSDISEASLDYASRFIPRGSLLVGYELTEPTRHVLERLQVVYVDLWQHPIRFLDDTLFGFYSNHEGVYDALKRYDIPEDTYWLYANRARIALQKRGDVPWLPPGTGVFIGQTLEDKALLSDGHYLNILDFQDEFGALRSRCRKVYYSRHPLVTSGDEAILDVLSSMADVEVGHLPAYCLLASDHVCEVMTISSSVAVEARYFGKAVTILHRPVIRLGQDHEASEYLCIYQEFVSPHFWAEILAPVVTTRSCARVVFFDGKDKIRDMLDCQYNYRVIDKLERTRASLAHLTQDVRALGRLSALHSRALQAEGAGAYSVLICGAGSGGRDVLRLVRQAGITVAAFTDRSADRIGSFVEGVPVMSLEEGLRRQLPCIISSKVHHREILEDIRATARRLGLPEPPILASETLA